MTAYLIDNCARPITVCRPGERTPTFRVNTIQEAFRVIDLDIALTEEAGYDVTICSASPSPDATNPA